MKISKKWKLTIVLNESDGKGWYKMLTENFKTKRDAIAYASSIKSPKVQVFNIQKIITIGKKTFYGNVKSF